MRTVQLGKVKSLGQGHTPRPWQALGNVIPSLCLSLTSSVLWGNVFHPRFIFHICARRKMDAPSVPSHASESPPEPQHPGSQVVHSDWRRQTAQSSEPPAALEVKKAPAPSRPFSPPGAAGTGTEPCHPVEFRRLRKHARRGSGFCLVPQNNAATVLCLARRVLSHLHRPQRKRFELAEPPSSQPWVLGRPNPPYITSPHSASSHLAGQRSPSLSAGLRECTVSVESWAQSVCRLSWQQGTEPGDLVPSSDAATLWLFKASVSALGYEIKSMTSECSCEVQER